jgi:hypothetical protein
MMDMDEKINEIKLCEWKKLVERSEKGPHYPFDPEYSINNCEYPNCQAKQLYDVFSNCGTINCTSVNPMLCKCDPNAKRYSPNGTPVVVFACDIHTEICNQCNKTKLKSNNF